MGPKDHINMKLLQAMEFGLPRLGLPISPLEAYLKYDATAMFLKMGPKYGNY